MLRANGSSATSKVFSDCSPKQPRNSVQSVDSDAFWRLFICWALRPSTRIPALRPSACFCRQVFNEFVEHAGVCHCEKRSWCRIGEDVGPLCTVLVCVHGGVCCADGVCYRRQRACPFDAVVEDQWPLGLRLKRPRSARRCPDCCRQGFQTRRRSCGCAACPFPGCIQSIGSSQSARRWSSSFGTDVRGSSPSGCFHCRSSGCRSQAICGSAMHSKCCIKHLNGSPVWHERQQPFRSRHATTFARQSAPSFLFASGLAGLGCQHVSMVMVPPRCRDCPGPFFPAALKAARARCSAYFPNADDVRDAQDVHHRSQVLVARFKHWSNRPHCILALCSA